MHTISAYSIRILLGLILTVILFHMAIIFKIIPYHLVWGGRLTNDREMFMFETASIGINIFLAVILLMKDNRIGFRLKERIINVILWIFFGIFILNTIGNIFAKTSFEKWFAVVTAISALLIWTIVKQKRVRAIES